VKLKQLIDMIENDQNTYLSENIADGFVDERLLSKIIQQYGNIYQEFEMSNRFVNAHRDVSPNSLMIQQHSHTFYEIIYIYGGSAQYLLGTKRYLVKQDDVIIVAPGTSHKPITNPDSNELLRKYVMWINSDFVKSMADYFDGLDDSFPSTVIRTNGKGYNRQIEILFKENVDIAEMNIKGSSAVLAANAIKFFVFLANMNKAKEFALHAEEEELQDKALKYIEKHLSEPFTSVDCANFLHVSDSTLRNVCAEKLGVSFHRCVIQRRLIAAKALMVNESFTTLDEIAVRVGFEDYSSFFRAFKKEYSLSPREYKNSVILQKDV